MTTSSQPVRLAFVIPALGIAQIISYGTLFYSIAVLAEPMRRALDVSGVEVFGGFSIALAISGLLSPLAGRWIDARGGRSVLARGALVAAAALLLLAAAVNLPMLIGGWCVAGVAMSMSLYDPAFATLGTIAGSRYRQAITALTLIAGFASSIFWPFTHALESSVGWRETLVVFAVLELAIALPLVRFVIPARPRLPRTPDSSAASAPGATAVATEPPVPTPPPTGRVWLAACFTLVAFVFSGLSAHLVGLMRSKGFSVDHAVIVLSLIGPMQVSGRVLEMTLGRRLPLRTVGALTLACLVTSLGVLIFVPATGPLAFVFVVLYGGANGVFTIVKGVLPGTLFGRERMGALLGWLARPQYVAQAVAPIAVASALRFAPANEVIMLMGLADVLALGCFACALRAAGRAQ